MSELVTTTTSATVDEGARFRAFTALGLALAALMGGGLISTALQWLVTHRLLGGTGDAWYALAAGSAPLVLGVVALWLASGAVSSTDSLARPLGRSSQVLSVMAMLGAVLVSIAVLTQA